MTPTATEYEWDESPWCDPAEWVSAWADEWESRNNDEEEW